MTVHARDRERVDAGSGSSSWAFVRRSWSSR